ncbi:hypothetical protein Pint_25897 [Pistacia integerrima]|uniref:Uncharacterized protein n=1 Tax=Pistacia integerrima TaxID=434235 RepID=A0ACC0YF78_9ROSI|nr:hypothetical protein Pint_25897 [Pistacia integerrima]
MQFWHRSSAQKYIDPSVALSLSADQSGALCKSLKKINFSSLAMASKNLFGEEMISKRDARCITHVADILLPEFRSSRSS